MGGPGPRRGPGPVREVSLRGAPLEGRIAAHRGDFGSSTTRSARERSTAARAAATGSTGSRAGRRFFTLFFIPVIPLNKTGEHVQCTTCKTRYVTDVLSLPTAAQMRAALPAGMRAAASAMLVAGDRGGAAARQRAVSTAIQGRSTPDYTDAQLDPDATPPAGAVQAALGQVARQLIPDAKEWFLAEIVRIGMADGPLSRLRTAGRRDDRHGPGHDPGAGGRRGHHGRTVRAAELSSRARQLPGSPGGPPVPSPSRPRTGRCRRWAAASGAG